MTQHLTVRVAWHDSRWNGAVCRAPSRNAFCVELDRIRVERDDAAQDLIAGRWFGELAPAQLPPCKAEGGAFMNEREWSRVFAHPYQSITRAATTHGSLRPTRTRVPEHSAFAVPFRWMLRSEQERIDDRLPTPLPPDEEPPFPSPWVFGRERQAAVSNEFFGRLTPDRSLVTFYTKNGQPVDEAVSRLIVGIGRITRIWPLQWYDSATRDSYPIWDRLFSHSIRTDGSDGFLLPYHDYLDPTGDPGEDARRRELVAEIAVVPEAANVMAFSYAGELASADVTLSTLVRCLDVVRRIREHGVAEGPWAAREDWLNEQIAATWQDRGAFPGAGAALEALGMRLGTSMVVELLAGGVISAKDDPWPVLDGILRGRSKPPRSAYGPDLDAVRATWASLSADRRALLMLLSRFSLSPDQAARWFDPTERQKSIRGSVSDTEVLENPYRIAETDLGDGWEHPVGIGVIDRGLLPDATVAARHPVPKPSCVESQNDWRRVRGAIVNVLRAATDNGDSLLSTIETFTRLQQLDLERPIVVTADWLVANQERLAQEVEQLELRGTDPNDRPVPCMQLTEFAGRESRLASILRKRAEKPLPSLREDWRARLVAAIRDTGGNVDEQSPRHVQALEEQSLALETVTTRKLSVLVGRAGTGKTTVLGALLASTRLAADGILFLAPTGKARVRITQKTGQAGMTVAQFLNQLGRYDGARQRARFEGKSRHCKEKTVVIDECSMLTLDDLFAVLQALDQAHVQRIILVGDPNQLPPIGVGRPFADLVAHLEQARERGDELGGALGRLTVELRTAAGAPSDTLRLASWFTREPQPVDADRVLSDVELGGSFNDLSIVHWNTPEELRNRLSEQFVTRLGLSTADDIPGFNAALGLTKEGWVPYDDHDGAERFQILSPVRLHPHGVHELNRAIQRVFRAPQLRKARESWGVRLGDEEIVWGDKVILLRNGKRDGWDGRRKQRADEYLANGEVGIAAKASGAMENKALNVAFAGRPDVRFGFWRRDFDEDGGPLELAYALTVHKAQGSEFGTVFVVLPRQGRHISRELIYTALTRARQHLVLLVEGSDASFLYDLTRPERSETARRNSNLFTAGVRDEADGVPYAEYLIHRTSRGELVRSKSELVIANHLHHLGIEYHYERALEGSVAPGRLRPDFSFIDDAGDVIVWEHLGMLSREDYRRSWEWKRAWYEQNGFREGVNLHTTSEETGMDMRAVDDIARRVLRAIRG